MDVTLKLVNGKERSNLIQIRPEVRNMLMSYVSGLDGTYSFTMGSPDEIVIVELQQSSLSYRN